MAAIAMTVALHLTTMSPLPVSKAVSAAERKRMATTTTSQTGKASTSVAERKRPGPKPTVCSACHSAKIRCDKRRPCEHCVRRNLTCVFDDDVEQQPLDDPAPSNRRQRSDSPQSAGRPTKRILRAGPQPGSATQVNHDGRSQQQQLWLQGTTPLNAAQMEIDYHSSGESSASSSSSGLSTPAYQVAVLRINAGGSTVHDDEVDNDVGPSSTATISAQRNDEFNDVEWISRPPSYDAVPSILAPTNHYIAKTWFDHLLSFFGPDPYFARRRVKSLLMRANQHICDMHRFELTNPHTIQTAIKHPERLPAVDSAMIFALTAMGLRIEGRRSLAAASSMWQILPRDAVSSPDTPYDLSMQLQSVAETYMIQGLTNEPQSLAMLIRVAHASAYLMTLQLELSDTYLHYHKMAVNVIKSDVMQDFLRTDDVPIRSSALGQPICPPRHEWHLIQARSSTLREEATRLKLFPHWAMIPLGSILPNVEFSLLNLDETDLNDAAIYLRWPSDETAGTTSVVKRETLLEHEVQIAVLQAQGLQIVANCVSSWGMSYKLNYTDPDARLAKLLFAVESAEGWLAQMRQAATKMGQDPIVIRRYTTRYCVVIGHLNGMIIRRLGFLHNKHLRPSVVAAMQAARAGADIEDRAQAATIALQQARIQSDTQLSPAVTPAWQEPLDAPGLQGWLEMVQQMAHDIDEQRMRGNMAGGTSTPIDNTPLSHNNQTGGSADGSATPPLQSSWKPDTHQLDSLVLYVAATQQYSEGVSQLYALIGHPKPHTVPLAMLLKTAAEQLRERIDVRRRELELGFL